MHSTQPAAEMGVSLRARRVARRPQEPPQRRHSRVRCQIEVQDHCPMIRAAPPGSLPIEIGRTLYFLVWSCSDVLVFVRSERKLTFAESPT